MEVSFLLDIKQEEAVSFFEGVCLTIAGPGSGKTGVIIRRVARLIEKRKIPAEQILVITFTREAAMEMQNRFLSVLGTEGIPVVFGTFHSVFFRILREERGYSADSLLSEEKRFLLAMEALDQMGIGADRRKTEALLKRLDGLSQRETDPITGMQDLERSANETEKESDLTEQFARIYQSMKRQDKVLDYGDMLSEARILLEENPAIRDRWSHRFRMILVDEAQDMDALQFSLVQILAEGWGNLFLVGDDDQSIYGFRGARPGLLLDIRSTYPNAVILHLQTNYRSTRSIVKAAKRLIGHNKMRYAKSIRPDRKEMGRIVVRRLRNPREEAEQIGGLLRKRRGETAVLFRTRAQSTELIRVLRQEGIPFYMRRKERKVAGHWLTQDIISYCSLALGHRRREDLLRILNRPCRQLPRSCIEEETFEWGKLGRRLKEHPGQAKQFLELERDMAFLASSSPYAALTYLLGKVGYRAFLEESYRDKRSEWDEIEMLLGILMGLARGIRGRGKEALKSYIKILEEERLLPEAGGADQYDKRRRGMGENEILAQSDNRAPPVGLFTFHGSKGLEFDQVHIMDVNEGFTPSSRARGREALEEERRMFYVALTRAKREVYLYSCLEMGNQKLAPSRFLAEIQEKDQDEG